MLYSYDSTGAVLPYDTKRRFFIKYFSIAFVTLPGVAGGLAKELFHKAKQLQIQQFKRGKYAAKMFDYLFIPFRQH